MIPEWLHLIFCRHGADRGIYYNWSYGKYRVVYNDGMRSQPFCFDVACAYRNIFGGRVVNK